jgi:hypothetical protein
MRNLFKIVPVILAIFVSLSSFSYETDKEVDKVLSPYFHIKSDDPTIDALPLKSTSAQVDIVGVIAASENKGGNRDFVLEYQLSGDKIASGLMLYEHEDESFFLMMVQPPKRIIKTDIPLCEYIFINDVSGSMRGYPMDVSKKIMRNLVSNLRPEDRFNVLVFAGSSGWMSDNSSHRNEYVSNTIVDINEWIYINAIRENNKLKLFIDGQLEFEIDESSPTNVSNNVDFKIARFDEASLNLFNGQIDDIRIYNRALSETEILALYNEGKIANAGEDQIICENYTTLNAENPAPYSGEWSIISGGGDLY